MTNPYLYISETTFIFIVAWTCFNIKTNFPGYDSHIEGLVQDCSNSIANALEILQSCTKSSI